MKESINYQLSLRQIIFVAALSGIVALGAAACLDRFGGFMASNGSATVALAENTPASISEPSVVSDEQNNIEVYKMFSPGVAFITTTSYTQDFFGQIDEGKGSGSGSVIDAEGHIITNFHVIEGAQKLSVSLGGEKIFPAKLIGGDPDTDIAVLKIEPPSEGLTIIPLGDSDKLIVGQKVLAIGNPFGLDRTLTTGVISGLQRPIRARNGRPIEGAIQTDASINPGNSGGPLLDKYGKMIGINSQILSPAGGSVGVGFAIPVSIAKRVVPQLIQFGEVKRPKLGASLISVKQVVERGFNLPVSEGLIVQQVIAGGSAQRAGLRGLKQDANGEIILGDVITAIDGTNMSDLDDLYRFLDKKQIGDSVQVSLFRDGAKTTIPVKLIAISQTQPSPPRVIRRF